MRRFTLSVLLLVVFDQLNPVLAEEVTICVPELVVERQDLPLNSLRGSVAWVDTSRQSLLHVIDVLEQIVCKFRLCVL